MTKTEKTKRGVADAIGISRTTLDRYLKMDGAPKPGRDGWSISALDKFVAAHGSERIAAKRDPEMRKLKLRELAARVASLEHRNGVSQGKYMPVSEYQRIVRSKVGNAQRVLDFIPSRCAPEVVGLSVPDAEKILQSAVDEVIRCLRDGTEGAVPNF